MTLEAYDWLILFCGFIAFLGFGSAVVGVIEWITRHNRSNEDV